MSCFHEIRLPTNISRGCKGGPAFNTVVVSSPSGYEQRVATMAQALRSWDVSHALRNNSQRDELMAFFLARGGKLCGFRFEDPIDSKVATPTSLVMLTATTFQLTKVYSSGGIDVSRPLTKIVESGSGAIDNATADASTSTVLMFEDDGTTPISSGWTVDLTTGIATFDSDPGLLPTATCRFDLRARFDTDSFSWSKDEVTYGSWAGIPVVELR